MPRLTAALFVAGFLMARPTSATLAGPPLCKAGSSVVDLVYLKSTGADTRIDPTLIGSSLIFLRECPESVVPAFSRFADQDPELRHAWIEAVRSAARDSANMEVRGFLAAASESVTRLDDPSLRESLHEISQDLPDSQGIDQRTLELLFERQALATLRQHSECDGEGCFYASDNVLFLLGTHPAAVFRAMHADPADATRWLRVVGDRSFAGPLEERDSREALRQAVLKNIVEVTVPGFEGEQRASIDTLSRIRFRAWQ